MSEFNFKNPIVISYKSEKGFANNLEMMRERCKRHKNLFYIGHSLGGIYAAHLSQMTKTVGGVTISTPYGGSSTADFTRFLFPTVRLFKDIRTNSHYVTIMRKFKFHPNWTQVVTTKGNTPFIPCPNDGVVTRYSMTKLGDRMDYEYYDYNHFEIKMAPETISLIDKKMSCASKFHTL